MFECRIILNTDQFVLHQFDNVLLDLPVVRLYLLLHCIIAVLVQKAADFGIGLIGRHFLLHYFVVRNNLCMEIFLVYCLSEIVCYGTHKHTLQ